MEIFIPKYNSIKLRGYVKVDVFHPEDIHKMEPTFHDEGENTVDNNLLERIVHHIDGETSGVSTYQLPASGWHDDAHGYWDQGGDHDQENTHGILIDANATVSGQSSYTQGFFLVGPTLSQPDAYTARWVAESTWNGTQDDGNGATGTITTAYMGKYWTIGANNQASNSPGSYNWPIASYSITSFTMQVADRVKITWDIAVDQ